MTGSRIGQLEQLVALGNHRELRARADTLLASASPEEAEQIRELLSRTKPEPKILYLLAISGTLLVFLTAWAYAHHG